MKISSRSLVVQLKRDTEVSDATLDFELRMIRKAVGPALLVLLKSYGIDVPSNRNEMDRLIGMLV